MKLYRKPQKKKQEWESIREEIQKKSIGSVADKKDIVKKTFGEIYHKQSKKKSP